jgi:hypothetical protein
MTYFLRAQNRMSPTALWMLVFIAIVSTLLPSLANAQSSSIEEMETLVDSEKLY